VDEPITHYWSKRLEQLKETLEENNFDVFLVDTAKEAGACVIHDIIPKTEAKSISWGGSITCEAAGLPQNLIGRENLKLIDPFPENASFEEMMDLCRQALLVDLFFMSTNAVTETGILVNLDGWGNRVAALTFGPKYVAVLIGRNKIVSDLDEAMFRVKNYAAVVNAIALDMKTPCAKTSYCDDCKSPDRICTYWTLTEKSFPKGRIKVVLINEDLGF
jgi:L-lactate utilization protein LutB